MADVLSQIVRLKHKLTPVQRTGALIAIGVTLACLTWLAICSPFSSYEPLYPHQVMDDADRQHICDYLDQAKIDYQHKAGNILVAAKQVESIKADLLHQGIGGQKTEQGKGFELFDTNTWIKGEKELQVLEMRALKGQLERDLAEFENIKHASVILDVPPSRTFGGQPLKTKASVILTLMPHAQLTTSQLRAVCYHLAGAVRGLEPKMIAISDTKGRLYQAIDPDAKESISDHEVMIEAQLQHKIEMLLEKVIGESNFYVSVHCTGVTATDPCIAVVLNKHIVQEAVQEEVSRQIQTLGRGYGLKVEPTIDVLPFETTRHGWQEIQEKTSYIGVIFFSTVVLGTLFAVIFFIRWLRPCVKKEEDVLPRVMTKIDVMKLAHSLEEEDPETIAMMLTYLDPKRVEEILAAFPSQLQEQVLIELEKAS